MTSSPQSSGFGYDDPFYWSEQKLEILANYAKVAAPILARLGRRRLAFVDLMAGGGYYRSGVPGSTGHLAQIAEANRAAGHEVRCIAYEADAAMFAQLETSTASAREFVDIRNRPWQPDLDALLRELDGTFVVFFVDPIGLQEIAWSDLRRIVARPYTEVLVNFQSMGAARLAGNVVRGSSQSAQSKAALDRVFGDDSWLSGLDGSRADDGAMHHHLAESYAELVKRTGKYDAVFHHVLRADGLTGVPKYHLMFASRSMLAFEFMNNVLAKQNERLRREDLQRVTVETGQISMGIEGMPLLAQVEHDLLRDDLARSLANDESLRGPRMTVEDLFGRAFPDRFATYSKPLYRQAVTLLDERKQIIVHERPRGRGGIAWAAVIEFRSP